MAKVDQADQLAVSSECSCSLFQMQNKFQEPFSSAERKRKGVFSKERVKGYLYDYKAFQRVRKESQLLLQRSVASEQENYVGRPNLRETRLFMEIADSFEKV